MLGTEKSRERLRKAATEMGSTTFIDYLSKRNILFLAFCVISFLIFYPPFKELLQSSHEGELYSHVMLIPLVSASLVYFKRGSIFSDLSYSYPAGGIMILGGLGIYLLGGNYRTELNPNDYSFLMALAAITVVIGAFVLFYGLKAFRAGLFPLVFLVFMIPIPSVLMQKIISVLVAGSTVATHMLFKLTGIPFFKEGSIFHLPGVSVEIAKECSGIRSSLGLFITAILAGHLYLRAGWKELILLLFVFPVTVLKNGIRIVTLSWLALYVDEKFLTHSFLHRSGGFLFFIPALFLIGAVLWWLRKSGKPGVTSSNVN
jgi:exosortase